MAIMKKTFTVADTPVDVGWKKESANTHRKYPATKSQMTLFDRAWFMMTSRLQGDGITHAMCRTTLRFLQRCREGLLSGRGGNILFGLSLVPFDLGGYSGASPDLPIGLSHRPRDGSVVSSLHA